MTPQEIDPIKIKINELMDFEFELQAINGSELQSPEHFVITSGFTSIQAIRLLRRALEQLLDRLEQPDAIVLPTAYSVPEIDGAGSRTVLSCLTSIANDITEPSRFKEIGSFVKWLVVYEQAFGFWDNSEKKLHNVDEIKLKEQQRELEVLSKQLTEVLKSTRALEVSHANNIKKLEEFIRIKGDEFGSLANMVGKANNEASQITQMWEQATRQKGEFDNLINQASESIKNVNAQLQAQKTDFGTLKDSIQNSETELLNTAQTANETLKTILNSKDQIAARMKEAAELLGMSADAALGGKFNKREADVRNSLKWWRVAVGGSVVLAVAWAVTVFLCLATKTDLPYLDIIVNLVKTTPGFVLMGYVMAQYNKERAIEEEYAFKAAIAMTINAYANLLQENDSETNKTRQTMLLDAIKQVYAKPQMHREDIKAKTYKDSATELLEVLKNIKIGQ
jgi:hypothetical protein